MCVTLPRPAVKAAQSRGDVAHAIAWPASESGPPTPLSAQFSRTFFATLLAYGAPVNECYTMASHVVQTWCTTTGPDGHVVPPLPVLLSPLKAELPDNNSIPALDLPGTDPTQSIASLVPGWSDLRLLAPRAEVRGAEGAGNAHARHAFRRATHRASLHAVAHPSLLRHSPSVHPHHARGDASWQYLKSPETNDQGHASKPSRRP
eukprot:351204-Chlamydomonas_euryale.AAC.7